MADQSKIEWTDATWQPVTGCSIVSPGCTNCYAMKLAGTRLRHHPSRAGLTIESKAGPVWNEKVRFNEQWLDQPLRWKSPRRIFVCAHGDLFHESVPDEWIDKVFAVMALAPQHTFQVLTKRSPRMRKYLSADDVSLRIANAVVVMCASLGREPPAILEGDEDHLIGMLHWPLSNVWAGVSTERQQEADERIPDLLTTPAAVRFISAEPLLGPIDLTDFLMPVSAGVPKEYAMAGGRGSVHRTIRPPLDWGIVGGESGASARPMHPDWARSLRDQCAAAGVPFFFKQWGAHAPKIDDDPALAGKGFHMRPSSDAPGRISDHQIMVTLGKKAAGRLLDGVEHNGMPQAQERAPA